jgi:hypothetical protein
MVCSTVILGMGALALDVGRLYVARSELQRAADSAALAGASAYLGDASLVQGPTLGQLACERAQDFSSSNWTFGAPTLLDAADVVVGRLDLNDFTSTLDTSGAVRFNAVQVTVRRTANSSNGGIPYLFARVFGHSEGGVAASATAAFDDRFSGYTPPEGRGLLTPFTINKTLYNDMVVNGPDEFSYDTGEDTVEPAPDDVPEVCLYPYKLKGSGSGNFGLLNVGGDNQGVPELRDQILNGITPEDVEAETGTTTLTFVGEDGAPTTYEISGCPGLKAGVESAIAERIGDVIGFFLHDQVTGEGANAEYRVVGLRFGRLMSIDLQGDPNNKRLVIQPVAYTGPGVLVSPTAQSTDGQVGRLRLVR